jgi:hypothetical protein
MNVIENDRQLEITLQWIRKFEDSILAIESAEMEPLLKQLYIDSNRSMIVDLQQQVSDYYASLGPGGDERNVSLD